MAIRRLLAKCDETGRLWKRLVPLAAPILSFTVPLSVGAQSTCATSPHDPSCKLDSALHMLYWLAGGLGCLLAAVVILACMIYRKNKKARLTPDE